MVEEGHKHETCNTVELVKEDDKRFPKRMVGCDFRAPIDWFKMLSKETHWTFVVAVVVIYGLNQGLGSALGTVGTEYYMKDVQKVQTSETQAYSGIKKVPWIIPFGVFLQMLFPYSYRFRDMQHGKSDW